MTSFRWGATCANASPANPDPCGTSFRDEDWGTTWAIALLPYVEQANLFNQWDSSKSSYDQSPHAAGHGMSLVLSCPL
ncbi:MAG: DUF1559 domain-containing protein [Planctomycetaceae bacterium]